MPEYPLFPDPRAEVACGTTDYITYLERIPELFLKPEVPDIVKEHIRITQRVLQHSYFVYEFIDVAFMQVIIGLEKALRIKYKDTTNLREEKKNFNDLLKWAYNQNFFELTDIKILDVYREVRNGKVHHPENTLGGMLYLQRILQPIGFINDLYEDVQLRIARKQVWSNLVKDMIEVFKEGATLTFDGNALFFIRKINIVFVNNKHSSAKYYFTIVMLTDPHSHSSGQLLPTKNVVALNVTINKAAKTMTGTEVGTNRAFTISAVDALSRTVTKLWENQINEIHRKEDGEYAMPIDILTESSLQGQAKKLHTIALFDFYKDIV